MQKILFLALALCLFAPYGEAKAQGPPPGLVEAIAQQESGLNPLAVNVAGKSYHPATPAEAEEIIRQAQAAGKSFDVGLMQINSWWVERYDIPPASLLNPETNRAWGEWILAQELARHGLNWRAVGAYHSPDEERGRRYAWHIYWQYAGRSAPLKKQEERHAHQKPDTQNIPDPGGIRRNQGIRPQGRVITFDLQQTGLPGNARSQP